MIQALEGVGIAVGSLRANKVRAALTIMGVAIGVMVVMTIASMVRGINSGVTDIINQLGPRTFYVFRFFQAGIVIDGDDAWRRNPPLRRAEAARLEQLESIEFVIVNESAGRPVKYGNVDIPAAGIRGTGAAWAEVSGGDIFPGRSFTQMEAASGARVAVVNQAMAEQLFGALDPIGREIRIDGVPFDVIGVYTPPPDIFGEGNRPQAFMSNQAFAKHVRSWNPWLEFMVAPADGVTLERAIDDVTALMRGMRGLRPAEDNNFSVVTQDRLLDSWNSATRMFFLVMIALSSVALMVGGVGVVAIMMISVTERTREIGIRKALGARKRAILWQFLVEAATLTLIGGAIGMILGGGAAWLVKAVTPLPAEVPLWSIVVAVGASILTGVVFGMYPAARAARLDPVEALRYE